MKEFKYTTSFSSVIKALIPEDKDKYLAMASLVDIGDFIPEVDHEKNIDRQFRLFFDVCIYYVRIL